MVVLDLKGPFQPEQFYGYGSMIPKFRFSFVKYVMVTCLKGNTLLSSTVTPKFLLGSC